MDLGSEQVNLTCWKVAQQIASKEWEPRGPGERIFPPGGATLSVCTEVRTSELVTTEPLTMREMERERKARCRLEIS